MIKWVFIIFGWKESVPIHKKIHKISRTNSQVDEVFEPYTTYNQLHICETSRNNEV